MFGAWFESGFGRKKKYMAAEGGASGRHADYQHSLNDVVTGDSCKICRIHARGAIRQRLMELGILPSAHVLVVRSAPLDDPIELRLGDEHITLRREEAAQIEVAFAH